MTEIWSEKGYKKSQIAYEMRVEVTSLEIGIWLPSLSRAGRISKVASTDAIVMNAALSARCLPGHMLICSYQHQKVSLRKNASIEQESVNLFSIKEFFRHSGSFLKNCVYPRLELS